MSKLDKQIVSIHRETDGVRHSVDLLSVGATVISRDSQ
jgi:hypothetical protein